MDFDIPKDIQDYLDELDSFIEREIRPLEEQDDNVRFFDHRREYARTDFENSGVPWREWEELLEFGTKEQKDEFLESMLRKKRIGFGLTCLALPQIESSDRAHPFTWPSWW